MNCTSFTFADIFAGIGGVRLGLEQAGGTCVFSSETDPDARRTYEANFGMVPDGDIRETDPEQVPDFDILAADFPYSVSAVWGEDGLFRAVERLLEKKCPEAFLLENGRNLLSHRGGKTYEEMKGRLAALGYTVYGKVLNAWDYGIPQKRERLVTVGFREPILFAFPEPVPKEKRKTLKDILEPEGTVKRSYYVSRKIRDRKMEKMLERCGREPERPYITNENVSGMVTPHHYACSLRAGASANYLLVNNERRVTERELFRFQGFPDSYGMPSSFVEIKNLTGNSSAVPVVYAAAEQMLSSIELYQGETVGLERGRAKEILDRFLKKKRQEPWRVIQAAEILRRKRFVPELRLEQAETYKKESRLWRDEAAAEFLGKSYCPPASGQDSLFYKNALPPDILRVLGEENCRTAGAVEAYIYRRLTEKDRRFWSLLEPWLSPEGGAEGRNPAALLEGLPSCGMEREERAVREVMAMALMETFQAVLGQDGPQEQERKKEQNLRAAELLTGKKEGDEGFFTGECLRLWYERIFDGPCREQMRETADRYLCLDLKERFTGTEKLWKGLAERGYESVRDGFWK